MRGHVRGLGLRMVCCAAAALGVESSAAAGAARHGSHVPRARARLLPARVRPGGSDCLRLDLAPPKDAAVSPHYVAFKDFDTGGALDSALALIEHLMES